MRQQRQHAGRTPSRSRQHRAVIQRRRQRLGATAPPGPCAHPRIRRSSCRPVHKAWRRRPASARSAGAAAGGESGHQLRIVRVGDAHRTLAQRAGERSAPARAARRPRPPAGRSGTGRDTAGRDQQGQRQRVDQQDAPQQRRDPALAEPPRLDRRGGVRPAERMPPSGNSMLLVPVADAVERLDMVEIVVPVRNFLRIRLTWLSIVRSST